MRLTKPSYWSIFENVLPWATLILILYFVVGLFFVRPYAGILINLTEKGWLVNDVNQGVPFQVGDILTRVGAVTGAQAKDNLNIGFFNTIRNGDTVEIELDRSGQPLRFSFTLPGSTPQELLGRLNSQWFIPFIFWLAGFTAFLFLRPRGLLRRLFMLFCFLTAAWVSTGVLSGIHLMGSALIQRSLIWLAVPVYLHLHWLFPSPLRPLPRWVWGTLYGLSAILAAASLFQLLPQNLYLVGFIGSLLGCLVFMIAHVITQPAERRVIGGMVTALGFVLLPIAVTTGLSVARIEVIYAQIVTMGLVALPGFYFYSLYLRQLSPTQVQQAQRLVRIYFLLIVGGLLFCLAFALYTNALFTNRFFNDRTLVVPLILGVIALLNFVPFLVLPALKDERITLQVGPGTIGFSANRTAAVIIFILLESLACLAIFLFIRFLNLPGGEIISLLAAVLAGALLGPFGFTPFQRFFERRILGMPFAPENLLTTYAARITTSLELETLRNLLVAEVMPSLLVRQFAHLDWQDGLLRPLFLLRVESSELPASQDQPILEQKGGRYLPNDQPGPLPAWVRLVLPLRVAGKLRGFWLLGQRDPDNIYAADEIVTLQALAGQTALALTNIDQAEALRALYFEDIERHEAERLHLAAELHDDVLNQLAVLNLNLQDAAPVIKDSYSLAVTRIREIISGLRPAMLNYGLYSALEALTDELTDRFPHGPEILFEIPRPESTLRYPARVELALFRLAQQACANAVQHAQCKAIHIQGSLGEQAAVLKIQDDGKGFEVSPASDLPALLAGKHFGLAGMFERAAFIGAELQITSQPGQGCQVMTVWKVPEPQKTSD